MRISADRKVLLSPVSNAASVVPSRPTKEALGFLRLKSKGEILQVHATDLEIHVRETVPCDCTPGEVALPAAQLLAILKALPDGEVVIEVGESSATVRGNGSEFTLPLGSVEALPDFPDSNDDVAELEGTTLAELIQSVRFATSSDAARLTMAGVRLERVAGDLLEAVGTDGRRLAMRSTHVGNWGAGEGGVTIPNKAADLILRNPGEAGFAWTKRGAVVVWFSDDQSIELATQILEGRFPDYAAVLPKDSPKTIVKVEPAACAEAIKRAALCVDFETRRLNLSVRKGGVEFTGTMSTGGASRVDYGCTVVGDPLKCFFNPAYLVDALRHVPGDECELQFWGPDAPAMVVSGDYRCLVMPLK
jgi:DNA polymerase-3 subunit beta